VDVPEVSVRLLGAGDAGASTAMSAEAFGNPRSDISSFTVGPGLWRWGMFDGEVLAAKANDRSYESWFGGRRVPTAGVAGVAVAPEYRSTGLGRRVMTHLLHAARDRGAVIATLFRTAPALYRSLGFEQVAELVDAELPASALAGLSVPNGTSVRRARLRDMPALRDLYSQVACTGSGLLTRDGPAFTATDAEVLAAFDGITLAEQNGTVVGYLSWHRGPGYGHDAWTAAIDLLATTGDAHLALLAVLGSFAAVTPTIRLRTTGKDPLHWFVRGPGWRVTEVQQYMLRVLDLAGAVAARGWPATVTGRVELTVRDSVCPWNSGDHALVLDGGAGRLEPGSGGGVAVTPTGLAVLFAGGVPTAALRRAGLISGGTADDQLLLDAAVAGPVPGILDYF
jgi:predicted acetyltransferase